MVTREGIEPPTQGFLLQNTKNHKQLKIENKWSIT